MSWDKGVTGDLMGGRRLSSPGGPSWPRPSRCDGFGQSSGATETWPPRGRAVGAARELCGADGGGRGSGPGSVGRAGLGTTPWGAIGGRRRSRGSFAGMGASGVLGLGGRAWAGPERGLGGSCRTPGDRRDLRRRVRRPVGTSWPSPPRVLGILWPRPGGAGRAIPVCRSSSWGAVAGHRRGGWDFPPGPTHGRT